MNGTGSKIGGDVEGRRFEIRRNTIVAQIVIAAKTYQKLGWEISDPTSKVNDSISIQSKRQISTVRFFLATIIFIYSVQIMIPIGHQVTIADTQRGSN